MKRPSQQALYARRGVTDYRYDGAGQLLTQRIDDSLTPERFAWDAAGNLLDDIERKSRGRVEGNRLRMWQDIRFEYDTWGNVATKRKGSRQVQTFTFDAENRLMKVVTSDSREQVEATFEYDAIGRRIGKTERTTRTTDGRGHQESVRFVWQGLRMVQEVDADHVRSYVYSPDAAYTPLVRVDVVNLDEVPDAFRTLAMTRPRVLHFHTDQIGTPQEVTGPDGELLWSGRYDAWGQVRKGDVTPRIEQPLRFAGQYADDSTRLHYNTFRYYDPDVGRFISQDPIGLTGGDNLYAYAPNPSSWIDPWGWINLNTNGATGNFGVYEINVDGDLYKYGKADLGRVTESSGLPTRLHQQIRQLGDIHGKENVNGKVIERDYKTTSEAKAAETTRLQEHYNRTGTVPEGNKKSFKPKAGCG